MARAGVVLERDGVCRNSHLSPKGHARHTRHADHTTTNLQVKAPSADLSGSLGPSLRLDAGVVDRALRYLGVQAQWLAARRLAVTIRYSHSMAPSIMAAPARSSSAASRATLRSGVSERPWNAATRGP